MIWFRGTIFLYKKKLKMRVSWSSVETFTSSDLYKTKLKRKDGLEDRRTEHREWMKL